MEEQTTVIETTAEEIRTETAEPQASDSTAIVLDDQTTDDGGLDLKSTAVGAIGVALVGGIAWGVKTIVGKCKKAKVEKAEYQAWKEAKAKAEEEESKEQQEEKEEEPKQEQETSKEEDKSENKKDEKKK